MNVAILAVSSLSLLVSSATLAIVVVGGKRMESKINQLRSKTNRTLDNFRSAIRDLEI